MRLPRGAAAARAIRPAGPRRRRRGTASAGAGAGTRGRPVFRGHPTGRLLPARWRGDARVGDRLDGGDVHVRLGPSDLDGRGHRHGTAPVQRQGGPRRGVGTRWAARLRAAPAVRRDRQAHVNVRVDAATGSMQ